MFSRVTSNLLKNSIQNVDRVSFHHLHYDVVVAGGGVMGSSAAYFLKQKAPELKVAVIERDPTYADSSSARSVASIRQQFSTVENIKLSQWSFNFMDNLREHLMVDEENPPDVQLFRSSYMFLATENGYNILKKNCETQVSCGADVRFLTPEELKKEFDWLMIDDLSAGSTCFDRREGWFDGWSLLSSFQKKAIQLGVEYIKGTCDKVNIDSKVQSVHVTTQTEGTKEISCTNFVNAAGPWAGELMKNSGVFLPVEPRKRYVYVVDCPKGPDRKMPLSVDPTGVYCRPEGQGTHFLCGCSPSAEDEPDISNLDVDYDFFQDFIWPTLAERFRGMEELKLKHSWAGYYDYNTFDQNGIIGAHHEIDNLFFINGFSGHGIQQSPAAGNSISELILDGHFTAIDLTKFGYERITDNSPVFEINVV